MTTLPARPLRTTQFHQSDTACFHPSPIHGLQAVDAVYFKSEERLDKYWPKFEEYASRNSFFVPENLQLPEQVSSLCACLLTDQMDSSTSNAVHGCVHASEYGCSSCSNHTCKDMEVQLSHVIVTDFRNTPKCRILAPRILSPNTPYLPLCDVCVLGPVTSDWVPVSRSPVLEFLKRVLSKCR